MLPVSAHHLCSGARARFTFSYATAFRLPKGR